MVIYHRRRAPGRKFHAEFHGPAASTARPVGRARSRTARSPARWPDRRSEL